MKTNTLYHFGDSFAVAKKSKNFGAYIAEHFNMCYINQGETGISNEQIFHKILDCYDNINSGDIVLINFSFLARGLLVNEMGDLKSTNTLLDDNQNIITAEGLNLLRTNSAAILDYFIKYNYDYNIKLFTSISKVLNNLKKKDVKVYHVFIKKDNLYYGNKVFNKTQYDFHLPNELDFKPNYYQWLKYKEWKNEEDIHYTYNIQKELSIEYIKRINNE
jgi:hypothetical protein